MGLWDAFDQLDEALIMRRIEAERTREAVDVSLGRLLNHHRQWIFDKNTQLDDIQKVLESDTLAAMTFLLAIDRRFEEVGVDPSVFSQLDDKQFVEQTLRKLAFLMETAAARLGPAELAQATACAQALTEKKLLDTAIDTAKAVERLQAIDADWKAESSAKSKRIGMGVGAAFLAALICPAGPGFLIATPLGLWLARLMGNNEEAAFFTGIGPFLLLGLVAVGGLTAGVMMMLTSSSERYSKLQRERKALEASMAPAPIRKLIIDTFGNHSVAEYEALKKKRDALIAITIRASGAEPNAG